jgi:hypothetical protein
MELAVLLAATQLKSNSGLLGSLVSGLLGWLTGEVLNLVTDAVTFLTGQIQGFLGSTTTVDLSARWFTRDFATMLELSSAVALVVLVLGVGSAVLRQDGAALARLVLVRLPVALVGAAAAIALITLALKAADWATAAIAHGSKLGISDILGVGKTGRAGSGTSALARLILALATLVITLVVWLELIARSGAIYVATLFVPLCLAWLLWPPTSRWIVRLSETLAALIAMKMVLVSVLVLADGAFANVQGSHALSSSFIGLGLMVVAAVSPWALLRLIPLVSQGDAGYVAGVGRQSVGQVARGAAMVGGLLAGTETTYSYDRQPPSPIPDLSEVPLDPSLGLWWEPDRGPAGPSSR